MIQNGDSAHFSATDNGSCWYDLFQRPAIAQGFPVPARDPEKVGLEIPLHIMAALAQAKRFTLFEGNM